jgi:CheY-like chemotaxis protein
LTIAFSVVKRHGGAITVKSQLEGGTSVEIVLPACRSLAVKNLESVPTTHTGKGRVLVLDDEDPVRRIVATMLGSMGYSVFGASSGVEAIKAFQDAAQGDDRFRALVLDLTIPGGMGGKEVAEAIRKIDADVPMFVSSGYSEDPIVAHPREFGFSASISKPFTKADLIGLFERYLGDSRLPNERPPSSSPTAAG